MNMTCEVARDLAELYHENLVSTESAKAIRAHLKECGRCRRYYKTYETMNRLHFPLYSAPDIEDAEARSYEALSRRLRKRRLFEIVGTGAAIGAGTIMLAAGVIMLSRSHGKDK